jgi:lipopolysaccharide export system permease protein
VPVGACVAPWGFNPRNPAFEAVLNILQKYILREWSWTFVAVTLVLLLVMTGVSLGELLNDIAGGRLPPGLLGELMVLKIPDVLNTILPLAVFIAVIWGLGRLYRDQEMAVMRASGFSWTQMLRPLFNLVLPAAVLVLALGLVVAPMAAKTAQDRLEQAYRTASEWGLQTGQFHVLRDGNLVLYVEAVEKDGQTLRNVFIRQKKDGREQVWVAEKGYYWLNVQTGERFLTLENGQITEGGPESLDFGIIRFSRNDLRMPEPERRDKAPEIESRTSVELLTSKEISERAEFQWRISPALAIIILGVLAIPLAHQRPREGRGGRVVLGILLYVVYANLLYMSRSWVADGALPLFAGMWWVHLVFGAIAVAWLQRQARKVGGG